MSQHHADWSDVPRPPLEPHKQQAGAKPAPGRPLLCKVVLHNDSGKDLMFVVRTVMELTRFCRAEATHKMWEAHHCGRSVLLVTYKERAELYQEQFLDRGLTVSVEPA
jgi:ATP-dependent Clp protease adapter protein ClpS